MKAKAVQIQWHRMQTITSVDFSPTVPGKFATAGGDNFARVWQVSEVDGKSEVQFCSTLAGHLAGVNVVRWSRSGDRIATGDNVGSICLWHQVPKSADLGRNLLVDDEDIDSYTEMWRQCAILTGHKDEVNDLVWSPCGKYLASVGTDQKLRIWDVARGDVIGSAHNHTDMIQGVAWDPLGQFIATQSIDRSCLVYTLALQQMDAKRTIASLKLINKSTRIEDTTSVAAAVPPASPPARKKYHRLFSDPTTTSTSFFRRLQFSPDGQLLLCPAAHLNDAHAVLVYSRATWAASNAPPVLALPGFTHPAWAVRFAPALFPVSGSGIVELPYRMVFAVGGDDALVVYDTQSAFPRAVLTGFHVYRYQDLAWSCDARHLVAVSHDGFCTVVSLDETDLGGKMLEVGDVEAPEPVRAAVFGQGAQSTAAPHTPGGARAAVAAPAPVLAGNASSSKKRIAPTLVSSYSATGDSVPSAETTAASTPAAGAGAALAPAPAPAKKRIAPTLVTLFSSTPPPQ
ncbi:hypothetical protein AMAG_15494 [Allomyces macrogynus ATCC 38327]|uniref:CAF1B/HIR1 beta-propeller domain-containing protein n=1 Tax=Allomyces macrogynus (strain ATCC 38327) TaxID=578462 RepID=A0A0L0T7L8_ALLM3|nr:hypothetical protein AMAG_15494 [Allomyces macrogynus ATCC 38327]|eukprot:KNE70742.1 hypothetical protein AMAG_15494 [Allomyces macrogynus ATCC 38327]